MLIPVEIGEFRVLKNENTHLNAVGLNDEASGRTASYIEGDISGSHVIPILFLARILGLFMS